MDFLDPLLPILRPLHVILGMLWFGYGSLGAWILHPAAAKMGEKGDKLLRLFYGYSMYGAVTGISAIGTTVAGLIMWPIVVEGADFVNFGQTGDIVMLVGAVAGLLGWLHGGAATGRFVGKFAELGKAIEENENPSEEQKAEYAEAKRKALLHANISAWITVVAVVCMSSARYLG